MSTAPTAPAVVPRWEWRTFGASFGDAERRLRAMTPTQERESDELYVLAAGNDASMKLRDDTLDIKRLDRVDDVGLEQWMPIAKAGEPLAAGDVRALARALGAPAPPNLSRDAYTFGQLIDEVVRPSPDMLAIPVHKRRVHFDVGGVMAELSTIRTDRGTTRTIAIESPDPARVAATVRELGLDLSHNVSLPRALKTLEGFDAHRFAVIDVGTNSVKFHVGERAADGTWTTIADRAEVTRLGEGLDESGRLQAEPIERTVAAIAAMADEARGDGVEELAAVGTAGLRMAPNRAELIEAVRARTGVDVEVITGEEEGRLAYLAVKEGLGLGEGSLVVFDTGGGSSQFTFGDGERVDERFSVDVGAARFTERFGLDEIVSEDTVAQAREAIAGDLARLDGRPAPDAVVGMGGAVTNLAAVKLSLAPYDPDAIQGAVLDGADIASQIDLYERLPADERRAIVGLQPNRAEVILAGALIVATILGKLGRDAFRVSDRGLRHGLLAERFRLPRR